MKENLLHIKDLVKQAVAHSVYRAKPNGKIYEGEFEIAKDEDDLVKFLIECKNKGVTVGAYGAAAKGNTLLNFAGVRPDLLPYVVDKNPAKLGKFMPGSRIPIVSEEYLKNHKPNIVLILPWNLKEEIIGQLQYVNNWGGKFISAVPKLNFST
jgi:hypothetical protein